MSDFTPLDFLIMYLESTKIKRSSKNKLRLLNKENKYEYSLLGAVADCYLCYRDMCKLNTVSKWGVDGFVLPDGKIVKAELPTVVKNWVANSGWGVGRNLINYLHAINKYGKGLSFSQVAQLIKIQFSS